LAQIVGSIVSVVLNVGLFVLFARAAPCILDGSQPCTYGAPSVAAWAAVAVGVTSPVIPVPTSSAYAAVILAILACITVIIKVGHPSALVTALLNDDGGQHTTIPEKYRPYVPNWNAIGLAFVVHQTYYSLAM
jgi:hypothetical protein